MIAFQQQVKIDYDKKVSTDLKQLFEKRDCGHLLAERQILIGFKGQRTLTQAQNSELANLPD